ncbi:MAG: heavy metal translocating P-type ATPase, partial [Clostridiales bacterium]|nr:heavy metal translocating P-type ATPase [Clostridiales bacterium]
GTGKDIAVESADIVLMRSDLSDVVNAIRLSKAVMRNIKQNLFWAFIYNLIGIPVAAGVFYGAFGWLLSPMVAAGAMSFSSVSVVLNATRLNLWKPKRTCALGC